MKRTDVGRLDVDSSISTVMEKKDIRLELIWTLVDNDREQISELGTKTWFGRMIAA